MSNNNNCQLGEAPWFHVILSTGFGVGFIPGAPGTYAAFMAWGLWYLLYFFNSVASLFWITLVLTVATTVIGAWTSRVMERYWGEDPRTVVIDEYIGAWIPALVAAVVGEPGITALLSLFGFAMFRVIDIFKPLGCRKMEEVPGGWGVMLDDALAGIYALVLTWGLRWILLGTPLFNVF